MSFHPPQSVTASENQGLESVCNPSFYSKVEPYNREHSVAFEREAEVNGKARINPHTLFIVKHQKQKQSNQTRNTLGHLHIHQENRPFWLPEQHHGVSKNNCLTKAAEKEPRRKWWIPFLRKIGMK